MKRRDLGFRSKAFTPAGPKQGQRQRKGKRYLLDAIPPGFWSEVRAKAKREQISIRALILGRLRDWLQSPSTVSSATTLKDKGGDSK